MNGKVNKFSLAGDKFMSEMHLKQPGCTHIFQKELDKACFQHNMAYGDFKDLTRRTASEKVLRDMAFDIAKNPKSDRYQRGLASLVYKLFDKNAFGSAIRSENISNKELAEELHKAIIRKFQKRKVRSSF